MTSGIVYLFFAVQPTETASVGGVWDVLQDHGRYYYTMSACKKDAANEAKRMFPNDNLPDDSGTRGPWPLSKIVAYCSRDENFPDSWPGFKTIMGIILKDEGDEE